MSRPPLRPRCCAPAAVLLVVLLAPATATAAPGGGGTGGGGKGGKADRTSPTLVISAPAAGTTVSGSITVRGTAADNVAPAKVEVSVDGGAYAAATGTSSWTAPLATSPYADGSHTITARATDAAGNASSTSVVVTFSNQATDDTAPALAIDTPDSGADVGRPIGVRGTSSDAQTGVAKVEVKLDEGAFQPATGTTSWTAGIDASNAADGRHTVTARATDTATGSLYARRYVTLSDTGRADLGFRPIVRSTDGASPISAYTGPNGLKVQSFNDVVTAREMYDRLMTGSLIGREAPSITVRLDLLKAGQTRTGAVRTNGVYETYSATSDVSWLGWLRGDGELFHEYGHAWSLYYAYMAHADPTLRAYLEARGVWGDPRLGSSYGWDAKEMIAEDYRQLFGNAGAQKDMQINGDLPPAKDVPGLRDFLADDFTSMPAS